MFVSLMQKSNVILHHRTPESPHQIDALVLLVWYGGLHARRYI